MSSALSDRTVTPTAIFTDPILGTPLQVYIHKDVPQRPQLAHLLTVYGGALATSLSDVTFIIVDPTKESGQAVFRQHGAKKNKIILNSRWIHACIDAHALQTFQTSWAGCKVTGAELALPQPQAQPQSGEPTPRSHSSYYPHLQQAEAGPSHQQAYFPVTRSHPTHAAQLQSSTSQHAHVAQPSPNLPPQLSPHVLVQPLSSSTGHSYTTTGQPYTHITQHPTSLNTDQRLHHASGLTAANHPSHFPASDLNPQSQHPHPQAHSQTYTSLYPAQNPSPQHPYAQWQPHVQQQTQQQLQQQHHFAHPQPRNQASLPPSAAGASNLPQPPQVQDDQMRIRPPELQDLSQPPNLPPDPTFQNVNPSAPSGTHGYGQGDHNQTQAQSAPGPGPNDWQPQVQEYEWAQQEPQQQQHNYEFYSGSSGPQTFEYTAGPYNEAPGPSTLADSAPSATELSPPVSATPSTPGDADSEPSRGRKRKRSAGTPSAQPSPVAFVPSPLIRIPSRSPTPPTSVIPSPYGGHVFTPDDHRYLTRYIEYCSATSQILSLKEICERVAKKAEHHSVASWKRYASKKGLAVEEYVVRAEEASERSAILPPAPPIEGKEEEESDAVGRSRVVSPVPAKAKGKRGKAMENAKDAEKAASRPGQGMPAIAAARARVEREGPRSRSPTPPRALFRSTTGKGVAFTDGDVVFLLRFLEYRKHKPDATSHDKAEFWTELARRAPHHSKTSWAKFYRRHREALSGNAPPPPPPEKRLRYSSADDVLLAKFWADPDKPAGASDVVYQGFARLHPHHPWKGWQEHARLHKAKIEELVERVKRGEDIEAEPEAEAEEDG
ncbi:unnamed protein product [Peniophora sp. CBMAI 1063]|nr:unnamed protein product [Peniophora sp. CBMAI 1063]